MIPVQSNFRAVSALTIILIILSLAAGCSGGSGSPIDSSLNEPTITPGNIIHEIASIGPDGGSIDLGWFRLEFAPGALEKNTNVEISQATLKQPREGAVVGGVPLHVRIRPDGDLIDSGRSPFTDDGYYTVTYNLNVLPDNGSTGDFSATNKYIDITAEWSKADGTIATGCAWAHRDGDLVSTFPTESEITLALVDFSSIPEIKSDAVFTDDPRELTGIYERYGQGIQFDEKNKGPLGNRIPVILIHGLNLPAQLSEPWKFTTINADYGYQSWKVLLDLLKDPGISDVYNDFKFFWFCYPTGNMIYGDSGSGQMLKNKLINWAESNDPVLTNRPAVIVAHSEGGLVAREYMQNQGGNVHRLITVCTPHLGTPLVNVSYHLSIYPGYGWVNDLKTPGIEDLACNEAITYKFDPTTNAVTDLMNPLLGELNASITPEDKARIILYGATDIHLPTPGDIVQKLGLYVLRCVIKPNIYKEGYSSFYSDCIVPWNSQFFGKSIPDLSRASTKKYHMSVLEDGFILMRLYVDLMHAKDNYPYPQPGGGDLIWAKRAGGTNWDYGYGITTLSDNSTVVTGYFDGSATFGSGEPNQTVLNSAEDSEDIFIARYNTDGTLAWAKRAGGAYADEGYEITMLSDNSTVVTGYFYESATFGEGEPNETVLTSAESYDIFIARYNPDGTLAWAKRAGGTTIGWYGNCGNGITTLSDNSTVVTGYFYESATFGEGEPNETVLTSAGYYDIFIARYNPDGTLAWAKRAGGASSYDLGIGITTLSDNSTVVTGYFVGSATFGEGEPNETVLTSAGYHDIFIARYNPDGTLVWAKRAGGTSYDDVGIGITTLSDNSTVVTGFFVGSATFGPGEPNETVLTSADSFDLDIFIARYNPDGTLAWAKCAGGSYDEYGRGITTLSDNSTVVTGNFLGSATFGPGELNQTVLTSAGSYDIFIARYNPDGTLAWAKRAGGAGAGGYQSGHGITAFSDNSTVVTGLFYGSATFGEGEPNETVLTFAGHCDIFIARFAP